MNALRRLCALAFLLLLTSGSAHAQAPLDTALVRTLLDEAERTIDHPEAQRIRSSLVRKLALARLAIGDVHAADTLMTRPSERRHVYGLGSSPPLARFLFPTIPAARSALDREDDPARRLEITTALVEMLVQAGEIASALAEVERLPDGHDRIGVLVRLVSTGRCTQARFDLRFIERLRDLSATHADRLPQHQRGSVAAVLLDAGYADDAIRLARGSSDPRARASALSELGRTLGTRGDSLRAEVLFEEAAAEAQTAGTDVLVRVAAGRVRFGNRGRGWQMVEAIADPEERDRAFSALSSSLRGWEAELSAEALRRIDPRRSPVLAASGWAPAHPRFEAPRPGAAEAIRGLLPYAERPGQRDTLLIMLVRAAGRSAPDEAERAAGEIRDGEVRAGALKELVQALLARDAHGALALARRIGAEPARTQALSAVAVHFAEAGFLDEAFAIAADLTIQRERQSTLGGIARHRHRLGDRSGAVAIWADMLAGSDLLEEWGVISSWVLGPLHTAGETGRLVAWARAHPTATRSLALLLVAETLVRDHEQAERARSMAA